MISVDETTDLAEVARLIETKRIKRVPVLRDGVLVGIISRANLVRALAAIDREPAIGVASDDREIRAKLLVELNGREWARVWPEDIVVQDGVVHLSVSDDRPEAERALRVAAENVPGVRRIEEHIAPIPIFPRSNNPAIGANPTIGALGGSLVVANGSAGRAASDAAATATRREHAKVCGAVVARRDRLAARNFLTLVASFTGLSQSFATSLSRR